PTPEGDAIRLVHAALDAGITLFDTANTYAKGEAERILGKALRDRRPEALIATKAYYPTGPESDDRGNSRAALLKACNASLDRLGTDYIDFFQLHRPDFDVPMEETMGALHELVEAGKARFVGSSTSPAWRTLEGVKVAEAQGWAGFVTEQPPYNILDRRIENELVPMALQFGLGLFPWSPLAMGMLAGRYSDDTRRPTQSRAAIRGGIYAERVSSAAVRAGNTFARLARDHGYHPAQLAICWVKDQPAVAAPLIGPKTLEQLTGLIPVGDMTFPEALIPEVDRICRPGSAVADFHNSADWMQQEIADT
ncbi:MAG: aldo/keto reductase, partial [Acidimicrobiia bacterium]|nr:aldo/keto reductase [Acidimicrobiia bacterium]